MSTRAPMQRLAAGLAACLLLAACQNTPKRVTSDQTTVDPLLSQVQIVDVAVLEPDLGRGDNRVLANNIREECRRVLIDGKSYAVPADQFVDTTLAGRELPPQQTAGVLGSDGVLLVRISSWDTGDLIPKGRMYADGEFVLFGNGKPLWRRTFKDKPLIAPSSVTAANRTDSETEIMRSLVRDMLSSLPRKRQR